MHTESQVSSTLLMIRPFRFGYNAETAATNVFQERHMDGEVDRTARAVAEFDSLVRRLRENKIYVWVLQDDGDADTPDAVFPNNWISFHPDKIIIYPMLAPNRRRERKPEWIRLLQDVSGKPVLDWSYREQQGNYLEGTGSLVLDRAHRVAYANISSRTNEGLFNEWCREFEYRPVAFHATTAQGAEIYHTNVMMAVGVRTAVVCREVIRNHEEKAVVLNRLGLHHKLVWISEEQMRQFAGNMLQVISRDRKLFWVLSERSWRSLNRDQQEVLQEDSSFIICDLETIEKAGGGSARCMMAEAGG